MRPGVVLGLLGGFALACLSAPSVFARDRAGQERAGQERAGQDRAGQDRARSDAFQRRSVDLYPGDPDGDLKRRIEKLMGLYLVDPPRRHEKEVVVIKGGHAEVRFWQPIGESSPEALQTRAVEWFVNGRTGYASGMRGVFSELPTIDKLSLVFLDISREDQKGRRSAPDRLHPYLRITMSRARFSRFDPTQVETCLEREDCSGVFRKAFDEGRFDKRVWRRRRAR